MPRLRSPADQQVDAAIEELLAIAAATRGLTITPTGPEQVKVAFHSGDAWLAKVLARDALSQRAAEMLVTSEARGSKLVVANQLSDGAKDVLAAQNARSRSFFWSWLDRRGELQLNSKQGAWTVLFGERSLPLQSGRPAGWRVAAPASDGPIRGRAGMSYAAALLLDPDAAPSIRSVAEAAGMSHGAVGEAAKLLRDEGLVRPDGLAQVPELFWALAAVWGPTRATPVAALPAAADYARLATTDEKAGEVGWAAGGDEAAAAWGAPLFSVGARPWIWVPTEADARRAERALGAGTWEDHEAVVAVPATRLVCRFRIEAPRELTLPLPSAHPLFLALDLAQDPSRGREVLEDWTPQHPEVRRVW